ncbi:nucleosome assembly protein (NAP) domain-containing protein [Phthorimaea operculella]|nr:nucleosome assembly protein (NAP) domain-containing protein [Phthorimaea operculella]
MLAGDVALKSKTDDNMAEEGDCIGYKCATIMFLATLPPNVRRRMRSLRALHKQLLDIQALYYREIHALDCKYEKIYKPLLEKRAKIVNGQYEPTDEECRNPWLPDEEALVLSVQKRRKDKKGVKIEGTDPPMDPNVKGIPDFWLTVFRNVPLLADVMIEEDEPIIKYLQDIKVYTQEEPMGFKIEYHFAPNEFFENTVLTKEYTMKCKPDEKHPLEFEGPDILTFKGCEIAWKEGKNVTVMTVEKKVKNKKKGGKARKVNRTVETGSFFRLFWPPNLINAHQNEHSTSSLVSEIESRVVESFDIDRFIAETVIPRAELILAQLSSGRIGLSEARPFYIQNKREMCARDVLRGMCSEECVARNAFREMCCEVSTTSHSPPLTHFTASQRILAPHINAHFDSTATHPRTTHFTRTALVDSHPLARKKPHGEASSLSQSAPSRT